MVCSCIQTGYTTAFPWALQQSRICIHRNTFTSTDWFRSKNKKKAFFRIAWGNSLRQQKTVALLFRWLCMMIKDIRNLLHMTHWGPQPASNWFILFVFVLHRLHNRLDQINKQYSVFYWLEGNFALGPATAISDFIVLGVIMETTGPRDRLVWEEMGKDCKGKVRYWLLSCYICVKRCEWSMLQLDSLWCSSKGCRRYFILCLKQL